MERIKCDCGHIESEHSNITRGYGTDREGKTFCYDCCLKNDLEYLRKEGCLTAYLSEDLKRVTSWPGLTIANIIGGHRTNLGYRRNQFSFDAKLEDGTEVYGYGPGPGEFCRIKIRRNKKK